MQNMADIFVAFHEKSNFEFVFWSHLIHFHICLSIIFHSCSFSPKSQITLILRSFSGDEVRRFRRIRRGRVHCAAHRGAAAPRRYRDHAAVDAAGRRRDSVLAV